MAVYANQSAACRYSSTLEPDELSRFVVAYARSVECHHYTLFNLDSLHMQETQACVGRSYWMATRVDIGSTYVYVPSQLYIPGMIYYTP